MNRCKYYVACPQNDNMDVEQGISCRKCGVQYVGKTSQTVRCRVIIIVD